MLSIAKQLNWVDLLAIIVILRILFVSAKNGFAVELFKFLGLLSAVYLSLHFYSVFSGALRQKFFGGKTGPEFLDFAVFLGLAAAGFLGFAILRNIFCRLIKIEAVSAFNRWGGFILGAARALLLCGLVVFTLVISGNGYLKNSVKASYCGKRLISVAPDTYSWMWNAVISKFAKSEKFNQDAATVREDFLKNETKRVL